MEESENYLVDLPENKLIHPNEIGNLGRLELINVLDQISCFRKNLNDLYEKEDAFVEEIKKEEEKAEKLKEEFATPMAIVYGVCEIIIVVVGIILLPFIGWVILGIVGLVVLYELLSPFNELLFGKEREKEAEEYREKNVYPKQIQLEELRTEIELFENSEQINWCLDILSPDYFNATCIEKIIELLKNRRADSLKEALNLYENIRHNEQMEDLQLAIAQSAESSVAEAKKQTEYLKEVRKYTQETQKATRANAYINYRNYKDNRKRK